MSFYTSLSGLKGAQTDIGTISHNLANVETNGFKKSRTEFADIVASSVFTNPRQVQGVGSRVESISQQFTQGPTEQTGYALDLAINGDGFFATQAAGADDQLLFTRNGAFVPDQEGFIHDGSNNRLQMFPVDASGANTSTDTVDAQLPQANAAGAIFSGVTVAEDGLIVASFADGTSEPVGRVAMARFISPQGLRQIGSSNWEATGLAGTPVWGSAGEGPFGALASGSIERSNVDITEELVSLITAQRNFQANAKAIDTNSQLSQTIINIQV